MARASNLRPTIRACSNALLYDGVGNQTADNHHQQQSNDKRRVGDALEPVHPSTSARSQRPIGRNAGEQENQRIGCEKIIGPSIDLSHRDDDPNETDHRQANAHHRGRDRENVNADVFFEWVFAARLGHDAEISTVETIVPASAR
jgi:hypothetical protein